MTDLRRIRIDNFGLVIQTAKSELRRIQLTMPEIDTLKKDIPFGLLALRSDRPELGVFVDLPDKLFACIDLADEPAECLNRAKV